MSDNENSENVESGAESFSEMIRRMQANLRRLRNELVVRSDADVVGATASAFVQQADAAMLQASANLELVDIHYAQALAAMRRYR